MTYSHCKEMMSHVDGTKGATVINLQQTGDLLITEIIGIIFTHSLGGLSL